MNEPDIEVPDPVLIGLDFKASVDCLDHVKYCHDSWHPAQWIIHMSCGCLVPSCDMAVTERRYQFLYRIHRCVRCRQKTVVDLIEEL